MFELMRFAWNMCIPWKQTDTEIMTPLSFVEVIEMATINGAKALGLGSLTGSLTPGKRADIILVRTDETNIAPLANIETTIVQGGSPANVDTVLVDGRILKRHGKLLHLDVPAIVEQAERSALRVRAAAGGTLKPVSGAPGNPVGRDAS
jgi:cytosine/adenosine deaminase-related metal-dependent hydrolase